MALGQGRVWGRGRVDSHHWIQQALRRWHQHKRIPRGPMSPTAWLHQGNFTFFCDVILMTDPLHCDFVGCHFFWLFFIYSFGRSRSPPAALMPWCLDARNVPATHCNTLQHATHCNTLQHTATHCNTLQHTVTHYNTLMPWCLDARNVASLPGMGWLWLVGSIKW